MDGVLEFLKMLAYLGGALLVLAWIGGGRRQRRVDAEEPEGDQPVDDMREMGTAGGFLGGGLEDLFVGRFALRRRRKR